MSKKRKTDCNTSNNKKSPLNFKELKEKLWNIGNIEQLIKQKKDFLIYCLKEEALINLYKKTLSEQNKKEGKESLIQFIEEFKKIYIPYKEGELIDDEFINNLNNYNQEDILKISDNLYKRGMCSLLDYKKIKNYKDNNIIDTLKQNYASKFYLFFSI